MYVLVTVLLLVIDTLQGQVHRPVWVEPELHDPASSPKFNGHSGQLDMIWTYELLGV